MSGEFRTSGVPLIRRTMNAYPLRASLVATLVAIVVTLFGLGRPERERHDALFRLVSHLLMLILHRASAGSDGGRDRERRRGLQSDSASRLQFCTSRRLPFGSAVALSLALATCVSWNLGLWRFGRRRVLR